MEAIVVEFILVIDRLSKVHYLVLRYVLILVTANQHSDCLNLATPHGSRYNRSITEGLDEWRPLEVEYHNSQILVIAIIGSPVEDTQVNRFIVQQLLFPYLYTFDDCLFTIWCLLKPCGLLL